MNRCWGNAVVLAGLILMLGGAPSWGQAPPNKDVSFNANTAGGTGALQSNTTGGFNTAFGFEALLSNTEGSANTASGALALRNNTEGSFNTAFGENALS